MSCWRKLFHSSGEHRPNVSDSRPQAAAAVAQVYKPALRSSPFGKFPTLSFFLFSSSRIDSPAHERYFGRTNSRDCKSTPHSFDHSNDGGGQRASDFVLFGGGFGRGAFLRANALRRKKSALPQQRPFHSLKRSRSAFALRGLG